LQINKLTLGAIAGALVVLFVAGAMWYRSDPTPAATPAPAAPAATATPAPPPSGGALLIRPHSPTQGPAQAPVTIVEFFDPECEACRAMYPIVKQVMADFDGRVRLVIRYMPLHGNSVYAAVLLEAARAHNKYWEFLEVVLARQPEWASHTAPRPELLMTYAPLVGLDAARLQAAAADPQIRARIQQDQADGMAFGANRTPTFFINGKPLARLGYEELRTAVQAELR
jgi:protein-disulfide isomerase